MGQVEKYIINLKSPDTNTRIFACNMLRGRFSLPESAITALETATTDPDPQVADAARLALAIHKPESWKIGSPAYQNEEHARLTRSFWLCFLISSVFSIVTAIGLFYFGYLYSGPLTPFIKSASPVYGNSGCCGVECLLIQVSTLFCFIATGVTYLIWRRRNSAPPKLGWSFLVGIVLGILVGIFVHFLTIF